MTTEDDRENGRGSIMRVATPEEIAHLRALLDIRARHLLGQCECMTPITEADMETYDPYYTG